MDDDLLADCEDYAEEQRLKRLGLLRDEDGNPLYDFFDDEDDLIECECGIWWPACEMIDGLCPECRGEE